MKKSTKLITTAIALLLVISAMVIGIYAATSGTASISASVSWEAEAGLEFSIIGQVAFDKSHYLANGNSLPVDNEWWPAMDNQKEMDTISVNTKTTNAQATGMSRTLNAEFCDDTDDGVNNPRSIIYCFGFFNNTSNSLNVPSVPCVVSITKIPKTNSEIKVQYAVGTVFDLYYGSFSDSAPTTLPDFNSEGYTVLIAIKLTLINPDQSLSGFDAGVGFSITKA